MEVNILGRATCFSEIAGAIPNKDESVDVAGHGLPYVTILFS